MSNPKDIRSYEYMRELYLSLDAETREKLGVLGLTAAFSGFQSLLKALKKAGKQVE